LAHRCRQGGVHPIGFGLPERRSDIRLATLVARVKPVDFTREESIACDTAFALCHGGVLPELLYRLTVETFGQHDLVGLYALVSVTLNAFNVPVPARP
jgi:4-carboxymuconolactone decarboxylase